MSGFKIPFVIGPALAALAFASTLAPTSAASDDEVVLRGAQSSPSVKPQKIDVDLRDLPLAREWEPGDPIKEIPRRTTHPHAPGAGAGEEPMPLAFVALGVAATSNSQRSAPC